MMLPSLPIAPRMIDDAIDSLLLRLFRFRTRGFLRMTEAGGRVPPPPRDRGCHLYVHVPFCRMLCPFCSFHRVPYRGEQARRYFAALREELRIYHAAGHRFAGAYIGGGTPTVDPSELERTIGVLRALFDVREISVETNPRDLEPEIIAMLQAAGVTRLSVGVQSFDDRLLREMGRCEPYGTGAEIAERLRAVAGRFPTVNVDLIFNQPHQTPASLERDLAIVRGLGVNQVSCYPLMSPPSVRRRIAGSMGVPDGRRLRVLYELIVRGLTPEFMPASAWCFSRSAGTSDEYIVASENYAGVGSGAFGYLDGTLYATTFSLADYEHRIAQGLTAITALHRLGAGDQMRYTLLTRMFGLRLDREQARQRHGPSFLRRVGGELASLELLGAARRDPRGWQLTGRGMYWLMLMMSEFFQSVNAYRDAMRAQLREEADRGVADRALAVQ